LLLWLLLATVLAFAAEIVPEQAREGRKPMRILTSTTRAVSIVGAAIIANFATEAASG
jgi:hypothetical protein